MSKSNKKIFSIKVTEYFVPYLVKNGYFNKLIANRGDNFRKDLVEFLNNFYPTQPLDYASWKNRYNNTNLIPEKNREKILQIMDEGLAFALNLMKDELHRRLDENKKLISEIEVGLKIYENE